MSKMLFLHFGIIWIFYTVQTVFSNQIELNFIPDKAYEIIEGDERNVTLEYSHNLAPSGKWIIFILTQNENVAVVTEKSFVLEPQNGGNGATNSSFNFTIKGNLLGYTKLNFAIKDNASLSNELIKLEEEYSISVIRKETFLDTIFVISVAILVVINNVAMGCQIDLDVVKKVLKRPFAPTIGLVCQFIFMPLIAFGLSKAIPLTLPEQLGVFATGVAPGGGASNMWTYLVNGDVSLSITMTTISTIASFAFIPIWIYSLGRIITNELKFKIPFQNICTTLVAIVPPILLGILIRRKCPRGAEMIRKILKPFLILLLVFFFTFGVYVNLYLFRLFNWRIIVCGICLPWVGYAFGTICAIIFRQPKNFILTIAIETGIQNTGIPILLLKLSLPAPSSDLAIIAPVCAAMAMPWPLLAYFAFLEIKKRKCPDEKDIPETENLTANPDKYDLEKSNLENGDVRNSNSPLSSPITTPEKKYGSGDDTKI